MRRDRASVSVQCTDVRDAGGLFGHLRIVRRCQHYSRRRAPPLRVAYAGDPWWQPQLPTLLQWPLSSVREAHLVGQQEVAPSGPSRSASCAPGPSTSTGHEPIRHAVPPSPLGNGGSILVGEVVGPLGHAALAADTEGPRCRSGDRIENLEWTVQRRIGQPHPTRPWDGRRVAAPGS
jgi:hypothetical protein